MIAHEGDEPSDGRVFGLRAPHELDLHPSILLADRPIDDAREHDFRLARRGEGDPEPCCDQREHALLAAGVGLEPDAAAHERRVELAGGVTIVPGLNKEGFPLQALPIDRVMLREWMFAWDRRDNPLAVERRRNRVGPQRVARHQSNIDPTLPHGPLDLPLIHFRDRKHDLRMSFSPPGQEASQRFTDRRHSHREADFADDAIAILIACLTDGVELGQGAADVRQYRLAAGRQPNP